MRVSGGYAAGRARAGISRAAGMRTVQREGEKLPSLKRNVIGNWGVLCINVLIGFFLTPAIVRHLDKKSFGMWMLASSVVGYFGLLKFGIGTAVCRHVPLYRGQRDQERVSVVVSTAMAIYAGLGFLVFIASWFLAESISEFFGGGQQFAMLLRVVGLAAAIQLPSEILDSAIRGYEQFVYANVVEITCAMARAATLAWCVIAGYGLISMGWTLVMVAVVTLGAEWVVFRKCCGDIKISFKSVRGSEFKIMFYFALTIVVCKLAEVLTYESPKQILGKVVSLEAVGLLGVVAMLLSYYRRAIYSMTRVFMPRFSYLAGSNARGEIKALFIKGSRYTAIIAAGAALPLLTVGPSFLELWLNKGFGQAGTALVILAVGSLMLVTYRMSIDLMYGLGKQFYVSMIDVVEGVSVFLCSVILCYKYGLAGLALGVAAPMIVIRSLAQIYVCRLIEIGFFKYYLTCFAKPMGIGAAVVCFYYLGGMVRFVDSWGALCIATAVIVVSYCVGVYFVVLGSYERKEIVAGLRVAGYAFKKCDRPISNIEPQLAMKNKR